MTWAYDDGGRKESGRKGTAGDCVARAIAIVVGRPYDDVYRDLAEREVAKGRARSARQGIHPDVMRAYLAELGFEWTPTMSIGSGCRVHLRSDELPPGRLVVRLSRHICAVVDGVVRDTYDPSRDGTRCVYGYWKAPSRWA